MSESTAEIEETTGPVRLYRPLARPMTFSTRAALFLLGVLIPLLFLWASHGSWAPRPQWQSGELHDMVGFLLHPDGGLAIYPFLLYAIVSLALYLYDETTFGRVFWIRLGIASGIVVSLWYCIAYALTIGGVRTNHPRTWLVAVVTFAIETVVALLLVGIFYLVRRLIAGHRKTGCIARRGLPDSWRHADCQSKCR